MQKYILMADDDEDDRTLFEDALRSINSNVKFVTTKDGKQLMAFLDQTATELPDVLFLDLNMPLKNGYECLLEIRRDDRFKDIPVIIFSTSCEERYIGMVYDMGADHYLCKPNSFSKLKEAISRVLNMPLSHENQTPRSEFLLTS